MMKIKNSQVFSEGEKAVYRGMDMIRNEFIGLENQLRLLNGENHEHVRQAGISDVEGRINSYEDTCWRLSEFITEVSFMLEFINAKLLRLRIKYDKAE